MNKGKQLEQDFKESCKDRDIWVYRIKDSYSVLKTLDPTAYVPQAPAVQFITMGNFGSQSARKQIRSLLLQLMMVFQA